jgi:hypothetical protein
MRMVFCVGMAVSSSEYVDDAGGRECCASAAHVHP